MQVATGTAPVWSPDGKRIAYTNSPRPGECEVLTISPVGMERTVVATNARSPVWAKDGSLLVGDGSGREPSPLRYRLALQGRGPVPVERAGALAALSPDGRQVTYVRYDWPPGEVAPMGTPQLLFVANADGSAARVLGRGSFQSPTWSPDGSRILFTGLVGGKSRLFVIDVMTGETKDLAEGRAPTWSPDGQWLAYSR